MCVQYSKNVLLNLKSETVISVAIKLDNFRNKSTAYHHLTVEAVTKRSIMMKIPFG